ncbi:MAG: carboxylesterase family protein [Acidimicrobiales bacterium]
MVRELATGRIRGSAAAGGGVVQFLGVPYAGEVDGAARFRPAPPLRPWTGVRDATAIGPAAPQPPMSFPPSARSRRMLSLLTDMMCTEAQSENCLVLNIWEPVSPATNLAR